MKVKEIEVVNWEIEYSDTNPVSVQAEEIIIKYKALPVQQRPNKIFVPANGGLVVIAEELKAKGLPIATYFTSSYFIKPNC